MLQAIGCAGKRKHIGFAQRSWRIRVDMINAYIYETDKEKITGKFLIKTTNHLLRATLCPIHDRCQMKMPEAPQQRT